MVVTKPGGPLHHEDRPVPNPGPGQVRVKVHACGICHSDKFVHDALWPGLALPRVPGHEVAGVIDAVGEGVTRLKPGQKVGVGWYGGHCGACPACLAGDIVLCENGPVTGISHDGGYQEFMLAPADAVAMVPDGMPFAEAAPLLCAGVTTYNSLRNSPARPGDLVAVQGLGGLGHLGVQFARAMGFRVAAVSGGSGKEKFARDLGAHVYIDSRAGDPGEALQKHGGASVILATAPDGPAISKLVPGLGRNGCLVIVGAAMEPIQVNAVDLISARRRLQGWPSGSAQDSTDTMAFAALHGIKTMVETFPLAKADDGYARMIGGKARFRAVLITEG
jgi:D-arabinose 1-dehydrogenase-like Zn-dependent alcohol dehydrogenase